MQFDPPKVAEAIREEWGWAVSGIDEVMAVSSMGNVLLSDEHDYHWRICPEELSAEIVARTRHDLDTLFADPEAKADWQMAGLVSELVDLYGEPSVGECFGLVIPAMLGGEYSADNIRRRCLYDYLRFTGDLARQTKDLSDGESIEFKLA